MLGQRIRRGHIAPNNTDVPETMQFMSASRNVARILRSPFTPQQLSTAEAYIGRARELQRLYRNLQQHQDDAATHTFIIGDRGIGKTSLLNIFCHEIAEPSEALRSIGIRKPWRYVRVSLDKEMTPVRFVKLITFSLAKIMDQTAWKKLRETASRIESIQLAGFGAKTGLSERTEWEAVDEFAYHLADRAAEIMEQGKYSGLVIVIDEVDQCDPNKLALGQLLKSLCEMFQALGQGRIFLLCAGLPNAKDVIIQSHPSAWRMFDHVHLELLSAETLVTLLSHCIGAHNARSDAIPLSMTPELIGELVKAAEGFPHWLREFAEAAFNHAAQRQFGVSPELPSLIEVTLDDFDSVKERAIREIADNYYAAIINKMTPRALEVLRWLSSTRRKTISHSDLQSLICSSDQESLDEVLIDLERDGLISSAHRGSQTHYSIRHRALRNWIGLFPQRLNRAKFPVVSDALAEIRRPVKLAVEELPPLKAMKRLLAADFEAAPIQPDVRPIRHPEAFEGLPVLPAVASLANEMGLRGWLSSPTAEVFRASGGLRIQVNNKLSSKQEDAWTTRWQDYDVIAIPHYLLGYAISRGVWTLPELLTGNVDVGAVRTFARHSITCFEEICTFDNHWISVPYVSICKAVFLKGANSKRRRPFEDPKVGAIDIVQACLTGKYGLLLEGRRQCVSLWYEIDQFLQGYLCEGDLRPCTMFPPRLRGEDKPALRREMLDTNGGLVKSFLIGLWDYIQLVRSQPPEHRGAHNWDTAPKVFLEDAGVSMYLGWTDAGGILNDALRDLHVAPPANINIGEGRRIQGAAPQPIESWVFIFPRRADEQVPTDHVCSVAKVLVGTMDPNWQAQFAVETGVSPMQRFVDDTSVRQLKPWTRIQSRVIEEALPRGKGRLQSARIQAEVALYTSLIFGTSSEDPVWTGLCSSQDLLAKRWERAGPKFFEAMDEIAGIEESLEPLPWTITCAGQSV